MGIANQKRVHKKLSHYEDRLDDLQASVVGLCKGSIVMFSIGFIVTGFLDPIRARPIEFEWLQVLGMALCAAAIVFCRMVMVMVNDERTGW